MYSAISFSTLCFSTAARAQATASFCNSSFISALLMITFFSSDEDEDDDEALLFLFSSERIHQVQAHHSILLDQVQKCHHPVRPSLTVDSGNPTVGWFSLAWTASSAMAPCTALNMGFHLLFSLPKCGVARAPLQHLTHLKWLSTEQCICFRMGLGTIMCSGTTVRILHSTARQVF